MARSLFVALERCRFYEVMLSRIKPVVSAAVRYYVGGPACPGNGPTTSEKLREEMMHKQEMTTQMSAWSLPTIVQAVEPEAAFLLRAHGGTITRAIPHGLAYEEGCPWEVHSVLSWPAGTMSIYISPRNQEDRRVLFAVFLLPNVVQELHLLYDYRLHRLSGLFEEYFVLHAAQDDEALISAAPDLHSGGDQRLKPFS